MKPGMIRHQVIAKVKLQRAKELRQNQTPAEAVLWQALRDNKLQGLHFRRQQVIAGLMADFYCHQLGLVVEVDGEIHVEREVEDQAREAILSQLGLHVLRFTNQQVLQDLPSVLGTIVETASALSPLPFREGGRGLGLI